MAHKPIERRFAPADIAIERREDGTATLRGHAAVWYRKKDPGTEYQLWSDTVEHIEAGAFAKALADKQDTRALFNHDASAVLGRTAAGTLRLSEDKRGLLYEIDLPDTQLARDLAASIERGDISGSSFSFTVAREEWKLEKNREIRTILEVGTLYDVGPVTFPAYTSTDAGIRAAGDCDEARQSRERWRRQQRNRRIAKLSELGLTNYRPPVG